MSAGASDLHLDDHRVVMSGVALVEGHEDLVAEARDGTSLKLQWVRDDDNVITGGTLGALTADLPIARPLLDVVHLLALSEGERRVEARFHVEWLNERSRRVTYTVVANF